MRDGGSAMPRSKPALPTKWKRIEPNIEQLGRRLRVRVRVSRALCEEHFVLDDIDEARGARDRLLARRRRGQAGLTAVDRAMTIDDAAVAYMASRSDWSVRSRYQYETDWSAMKPYLGHIRVVQHSIDDVEEWLIDSIDAGLAKNTYTNRLTFLRSVLDRPCARLGVPNMARLVKPPRTRRATVKRARKVLTPDELTKLIGAASELYRIVWLIGLALGLRSAEIRGLTLDRVDPDTGLITIDRQLLRVRGDDVIKEPGAIHVDRQTWLSPLKAENSYAVLQAGRLVESIHEHVERFGLGPAGLIVSNSRGGIVSDQTWSQEVQRVRQAVGVAMVGHDLRRTYGKRVLVASGDITKVAGALRNDVNTAVRAYLIPDLDENAYGDALLDAVLGNAACQTRAKKHLRVV